MLGVATSLGHDAPVTSSPADILAPDFVRLPLRTPTLPPATTTNAVFIGDPGAAWVVDPATPHPDERARLLAAAEAHGTVGIFLTHHHPDHVGAAAWLAREAGLPIAAHPRTATLLGADGPGRPDALTIALPLEDGDMLAGWQALHTPGHASGHLCLWHAATGRLVAGDMVASIGTIVIDPPDGHMGTYLAQLARLRALQPKVVVPAHGAAITDPDPVFAHYLAHRALRESLVLAALTTSVVDLADVTRRAYPELAPMLLPLAARSALAHLEKLAEDGQARFDGPAANDPRSRWART